MSDDQSGDAAVPQQRQRLLADLGAPGHVKPGEGLVQQKHQRLRRQRPQQRTALRLPAGKRVGIAVGEMREAHALQRARDPIAARRAVRQTEGDILGDGQVREQSIVLKHKAGSPAFRRHVEPGTAIRDRPTTDGDAAPAQRL